MTTLKAIPYEGGLLVPVLIKPQRETDTVFALWNAAVACWHLDVIG